MCVLILYPPFIYSREPRVRTTATDFSNQWRGDTWRSCGGGAHGPGRPTWQVGQPTPASSSRLSWASLSGPRWSWPVLACLNWVLALLVHLSLNRCSDNFCASMSGQSVLVTCILALKCNLHFLKGEVWFRNFIG